MIQKSIKLIVTVIVTGVAVLLGLWKYGQYLENPWTRDGQVRANVIQVTPRVSGPIVELPIVDNQAVKTGELLFRIDPRTYRAALDQAQAQYDQAVEQLNSLDKQIEAATAAIDQAQSQIEQGNAQVRSAQATVDQSEKQLERYRVLLGDGYTSRSVFDQQNEAVQVNTANRDRALAALNQTKSALDQSEADRATLVAKRGTSGEDNAQLRSARAALTQARLNFEFTEQRAPVDGYVTNLSLRLGSQANAGVPVLALVDRNSFWVDAYFRESVVSDLGIGDAAFVTLMSYPDKVVSGNVDSISWGIAQQDGSTSTSLLPTVAPSFEWIRLAQRIPVRIALNPLPEGVELRIGTTASIMVRAGSGKRGAAAADAPPSPVPAPLR